MMKIKVKYETLLWIIYGTITIIAMADRFTINYWPRQTFRIGTGSAGNDRLNGLKPGPWSVVLYDIIARVSGRFSICCFNFMLISRYVTVVHISICKRSNGPIFTRIMNHRLHIMEQWIASSWAAKHVIDCSNIVTANQRAHKLNGIALCILTLVHVWSILLPCVTHKWKAQVVLGAFEWPLSERAPPGFNDANTDTKTMSLQGDDVFRMVEMTLLLGILVPLSVKWMTSNWHLGIHVHRFITVLYFVDIVRRHSHPHSWILNTPIFVIWILDKVLSMEWRRVGKPYVVREKISNDYIALFWSDIENTWVTGDYSIVGSNYLMKMYPSSSMETRHPFTAFHNRAGSLNFLVPRKERDADFTHGAVIRVFNSDRSPVLGGDAKSHTTRLANDAIGRLSIWGPFQGEMTALIPKLLMHKKPQFSKTNYKRVIFVGSGSAVNFLLDAVSFLVSKTSPPLEEDIIDITVLCSTRDEALHAWVVKAMATLLERPAQEHCIEIKVILALTSAGVNEPHPVQIFPHKLPCDVETSMHSVSTTCDDTSSSNDTLHSIPSLVQNSNQVSAKTWTIEILKNRIAYSREIQNHSVVFCQGSTVFKEMMKKVCLSKDAVKLITG